MEILVILLLILFNGLFAMSEIALISARRSNLEMQARQGSAGGPPGPEAGQRPPTVPLDGADRHHAHRNPHGYLFGRHAGRQIRPGTGRTGHPDACGDRHGAGHDRHRSHLPHDHLRRAGTQAHRHERRGESREDRGTPHAGAFGRGVAVRMAALQKHGGRHPPAGTAQGREQSDRGGNPLGHPGRAPKTAKCRRSRRRSWAASFRWATARWSRS